jgi:predicted AAA+ superfamily ATPase
LHGYFINMYINRFLENAVLQSLANFPVTAIIGPRQCGKSTMARYLISMVNRETIYLDLERPSDLQKLQEPEWFLSSQKDKLICIDEIQRKPEIFPLMRSLTDEWKRNGNFLVLGSASRDLLRQSSESLAGRISYKQLTPLLWNEIIPEISLEQYFEKGGFPRSLLAKNLRTSFEWRLDFISTFLERDLLQWSGFTPATMRKLWQMIAHNNGQTVNFSAIGNSLNVSNVTIRNYIDLLSATFMIYLLPPYIANTGKRLIKSPKVFIEDTGIINALLGLNTFEQISGHPVFGSLWETIVLINLKGYFPLCNFFFYRTTNGAEIDFIIESGTRIFAIECKATLSPDISRGTYTALEDLKPESTLVISPVKKGWTVKKNIQVVSLKEAIDYLKGFFPSVLD